MELSILICKSAADASRALLTRRDLHVRWALTADEARSVIRRTRCDLCIARGPVAKAVLAACAEVDGDCKTIVLLDPDDWSSWRDYYKLGAAAVLRARAADELLDAVGAMTGLAFRAAPRIAFDTRVTFAYGDEGGEWRSRDVSTTGISIDGFPPYAIGTEVDLELQVVGARFVIGAVVARMFRIGDRRVAGLAFRDVPYELRTNLDELIRAERRRLAETEQLDELEVLDESTVRALRAATVPALTSRLTASGELAASSDVPRWVIAARDVLSVDELEAMRDPSAAPSWAHDALLARLRVYQSRAGSQCNADVREIFGLCRRLGETASGADAMSLARVAGTRAEILRALYSPHLLDDHRLDRVAR